jgi:predicted nucleic acid-binding protein
VAAVIAVDASFLIAHLDDTDAHHDRATQLLLNAVDSPLAASVVTVAEVLVGPARAGRLEAARSALAVLGVEEIAVGGDASVRLATLRAESSLKLPDCCVLLAARDAGADTVLSFDDQLVAAARRAGFSTP